MKPVGAWISVPSTNNLYEVNEYGDVRKVSRGIPLTASVTKVGYKMVSIVFSTDNVQKRYVHDLISEVFIGKKPLGKEVNHIDGDKTNNKVSNLEYITRSENIKHGLQNGLVHHGEARSDSKLKKETVVKIRFLRRTTGLGATRIAKILGDESLSYSAIDHVINNTSWKWDGEILPFEPRSSIASCAEKVLREEHRDIVMWGDCYLLDTIAEKCKHTTLLTLRPIKRYRNILGALGKSKRFKKGFVKLTGIVRKPVRCFKLLPPNELKQEVKNA